MTEPATLGTHAKWLKDANTKMISLYNEESVTTHTALKECSTNTNYQVPVGKKFVLLNLHFYVAFEKFFAALDL